MRVRVQDRIGQRFGKVVITSYHRKKRRTYVTCNCDCGNTKDIRLDSLVSGAIVSCGCVALENSKNLNKSHGLHGTPTYRSWDKMIQRCTNREAYPDYKDVHLVDEGWKDFKNFYKDMGERPEGCTLDRIKGNVGYCKSNCRWATYSVQSRNQKKRKGSSLPKGVHECWKDGVLEGLVVCCTRDYKEVKWQSGKVSMNHMAKVYNYWSYILYPEKVSTNPVDFRELKIKDIYQMYSKLQNIFPEE